MRRMFRRPILPATWLAPVLLALSTWAVAAAPKPYHAEYSAMRNDKALGIASVRFSSQAGGRYELVTSTHGTDGLAAIAGVSIEERSVLSWPDDTPETVTYSYRQKMAWKTRTRSISVDAQAGRIVRNDQDDQQVMRYQPGVLDRHAVTVALMHDLAAGKRGDLLYSVPERDGVATQRFRQAGVETLDTALGVRRVIRVERVRDSSNGRNTIVWFGVDNGYVPLRILQTEPNGDTLELRIRSIR